MKKTWLIIIAILVLVLCLVVAWFAERANDVPTLPSNAPTTQTSGATDALETEPSQPGTIPPTDPTDVENGLGWG